MERNYYKGLLCILESNIWSIKDMVQMSMMSGSQMKRTNPKM